MTVTDADRAKARTITGDCSCHEAYKSRGLIAPDCAFHDFATEIAEALAEVRRETAEEAAKCADALADELTRLKGSSDRRVQIGSHLETCAVIAADIRKKAAL